MVKIYTVLSHKYAHTLDCSLSITNPDPRILHSLHLIQNLISTETEPAVEEIKTFQLLYSHNKMVNMFSTQLKLRQ